MSVDQEILGFFKLFIVTSADNSGVQMNYIHNNGMQDGLIQSDVHLQYLITLILCISDKG